MPLNSKNGCLENHRNSYYGLLGFRVFLGNMESQRLFSRWWEISYTCRLFICLPIFFGGLKVSFSCQFIMGAYGHLGVSLTSFWSSLPSIVSKGQQENEPSSHPIFQLIHSLTCNRFFPSNWIQKLISGSVFFGEKKNTHFQGSKMLTPGGQDSKLTVQLPQNIKAEPCTLTTSMWNFHKLQLPNLIGSFFLHTTCYTRWNWDFWPWKPWWLRDYLLSFWGFGLFSGAFSSLQGG